MINNNKGRYFIKKLLPGQTSVFYLGITLFVISVFAVSVYFNNKNSKTYITLSDDRLIENSSELQPTNCEAKATKEEKIQCWDDQINLSLKNEGAESAFDLLAKLYKSDPSFAENCHAMAHRIGGEAYKLYSRGVNIEIIEETTWCGYGFYHSFVEEMMAAGEDLKKAGQFCDSAGKQLAKESPDLTERCYHGIGHGAVNIHDPRLWGNEKALIEPAVEICKRALTTEDRSATCASGVFNAIQMAYSGGEILKLNMSDPFWICREQEGVFKRVCYGYLVATIFAVNGNDFDKTIKFVENIEDDFAANYGMRLLAVANSYPNVKKSDHSEFVQTCYTLERRLISSCLNGYAIGLMHMGEPEKEFAVGFNFCRTKAITEEDKVSCFQEILDESSRIYGTNKYKEICAGLEDKYQRLCKI